MAEKLADIFLKIRLLQMLPVECNSLTNVQTNLNIESCYIIWLEDSLEHSDLMSKNKTKKSSKSLLLTGFTGKAIAAESVVKDIKVKRKATRNERGKPLD